MPKAPKSKKAVHPNSRHASQMARSAHKNQRAEGKLKEKSAKLGALGDKLKWFQDSLEEGKTSYNRGEACVLIEQYLDRFKEELEQIDIVNSMKGRSGNQHASREMVIKTTMEMERREYENQGLEIPDIINGKQLKAFREWTGELRYLPNIKLKRVTAVTETKSAEKNEQPDDSSSQTEQTDDSGSQMEIVASKEPNDELAKDCIK